MLNNTLFKGVPKNLKKTISMFEYNNYESFKKEFYKNKKNLSAVIMEVSRNFPPKKNFLKKLRKYIQLIILY